MNDRGSIQPDRDISRRAAARLLCAGGVAAFLFATVSRAEASAQATPDPTDLGPSRYTLKAGDIEIVFVPAMADTDAQLDYRDASSTLTFTGDDLTAEFSPSLGRSVSVGIEHVDDGYSRYLTLLVPDVNPDDSGLGVPIKTVAVVTTHRTSIGGPRLVKGAVQTYEIVALDGTAEFATS